MNCIVRITQEMDACGKEKMKFDMNHEAYEKMETSDGFPEKFTAGRNSCRIFTSESGFYILSIHLLDHMIR